MSYLILCFTFEPQQKPASMKKLLVVALATLALVACKKEEGEGGRAALYGKVMVETRPVLSNPTSSGIFVAPAMDYDIYITYGDNIGPDDRIRTNYDGEYEFPYLRPGKYTVWTYSRDTTLEASLGTAPRDMAVIRNVEISDKKGRVEVPTMTVYEKKN